MAKIRSAADIQKRWTTLTPQRTTQYKEGVAAPLEDWASNAKAAEDTYEVGISQSIANKSYGKGVDAVGTKKWSRKTLELGTNRWGPGVQAAGQDFLNGFAPYRDTIEAVQLPPRFPRGDQRNQERSKAIGEALHQRRIRGV